MSGHHLDLDQLADLLAAAPDGSAPALRADAEHVEGCAGCRAGLAELEQAVHAVSVTLAAAPVPVLPQDVAARWERALAEEPVAGAAAAEPVPEPPSGLPSGRLAAGPPATVLPFARRRQPRWAPWAAGAAAAAVLGTCGVLLAHSGGRGGSSASKSDTSAGSGGAGPLAAVAAVPTSSTGTDYTVPLLAAALPGLVRGGAPGPAGPATAPLAGSTPATRSTLAPGGATPSPPESLPGADSLRRLRDPAALTACLAALQEGGSVGSPLALDYARFAGAPALVVVLPSTHTGKVDVYAVGAGCSPADAQVKAFTRAPAP